MVPVSFWPHFQYCCSLILSKTWGNPTLTVKIKRRYNFDEWELIATYEDGTFSGDEDFLKSFNWLEGASEAEILDEFNGPNLLAVRSQSA